MHLAALIALHLLKLTGPDGQVIELNPDTIATLRTVRSPGHVARETSCMIFTTDGKNVNVTETCDQVKHLLEQDK
jgi:hypothetical protein